MEGNWDGDGGGDGDWTVTVMGTRLMPVTEMWTRTWMGLVTQTGMGVRMGAGAGMAKKPTNQMQGEFAFDEEFRKC